MFPGNKEVRSGSSEAGFLEGSRFSSVSSLRKEFLTFFKKRDNFILLKWDLMKAGYSFKEVSQCKICFG